MECPKCREPFEKRQYGRKIQVQRCTGCMGLFLKPDVLDEMRSEWMSEILDPGDREVGKLHNRVEDIACPECNLTMVKKNDTRQKHIWYEQCGNCEGIYFDAGEFTDLKHDTLLDRLRDWWIGARNA